MGLFKVLLVKLMRMERTIISGLTKSWRSDTMGIELWMLT